MDHVNPAATALGTAAAAEVEPPKPRLKAIDRQQMRLHPVEVERLVEPDHAVRAIWELVGRRDLSGFYAPIKAVEGVAGREAIDPRLLISLWVWALSEGVSSAREIERRCQYHPVYQWLTGLEVINYHTLSDFRTEHQQALHQLFVEVLGVLDQAELVSLGRVMHDGMKVKANAADNSFHRPATLEQHLEVARQHVEQMEREAEQSEDLSRRQQAARQRAAREKQQRLEQALEELKQIQAHSEDPDKARASQTDPEARIMQQAHGASGPAYNVQISTDAQQTIIVGVGLSQCSSDAGELEPAVQQVEANLERPVGEMVVDAGFTNQATIEAMAERETPLIGSLPDPEQRVETALKSCGVAEAFYPKAFVYDAGQNGYICPAGKTLRYQDREKQKGSMRYRYRAAKADCQACPLKAQCCPHTSKGRAIWRVEDSPAVAAFKQKMATPEAQQTYKQRAQVAEFPNAWIKAKIGLRQFRLRGLVKVGMEVLWACLTYNIQQWIRLRWRPQRQAAALVGARAA
jgi:transposase